MQAQLEEVLLLQAEWTDANTDAMRRRGVLVRQELPDRIRATLPELQGPWPELVDLVI